MAFKIELEQEEDGRWIAEVVDLPGVVVYGKTPEEAQALALRTLADRLENGESETVQRATRQFVPYRMSRWPSARSRRVLVALLRIGWRVKRQSGSHRILSREGWPDVVFAFHDNEEIGPRMLARIARRTGLTSQDM